MKKLAIPAILTVTVLLAGIFAFGPVEEASTVHTTILASNTEIVSVAAVDLSNAGADFSCDNNADDGTITFTLDAGTDSAELISLYVITSEATDAGDFLAIDINADGTELMNAGTLDADPAGSTEMLTQFDTAGADGPSGNLGPVAFSNTLTVDVACTFGNGTLDYTVVGIFRAPGGATITPTENIL